MKSFEKIRAMNRTLVAVFLAVLLVGGVSASVVHAQEDASVLAEDAGANSTADASPAATVVDEPAKKDAPEPSPPPAADGAAAGGSTLQKLSDEVMAVIVPAFGTLVTGLIGILLAWVRRKTKIQVSDQTLDAWAKLAGKAANRAAEWARKKVKESTEGKKVPGPEVLDVAVNWALEVGKEMGLKEMGRAKLEGLIEAHLFENRSESV